MRDQTERRAYCPRCNQPDIRVYLEAGVTKYRTHDHVPGGGVSCKNSGQPVVAR